MKNRATIYEMAKQLGLSPSTVARAFSGKINVKPETKERILKTAQQMNYRKNTIAASLASRPVKIVAIVYDAVSEYTQGIVDGINHAIQKLDSFKLESGIVLLPRDCSIDDFFEQARRLAEDGADGIVLLPHYNLAEMRKLIDELSGKGMKVAVVSSDISDTSRILSVRRNGFLCGGMAAQLLSATVGEKRQVAVLTGSHEAIVHKESVESFMKVAEDFGLSAVGIFEHHDSPQEASELAERLVMDYPKLGGVYINSANSVSFCGKISQLGFSSKLKIVASDLFPQLKEHIDKGTVDFSIFCSTFLQGKKAFENLFLSLTQNRDYGEGSILLEPHIVMKSNLEYYYNFIYKEE